MGGLNFSQLLDSRGRVAFREFLVFLPCILLGFEPSLLGTDIFPLDLEVAWVLVPDLTDGLNVSFL